MKSLQFFLILSLCLTAMSDDKNLTRLDNKYSGKTFSFKYPGGWEQSVAGLAVNIIPKDSFTDRNKLPGQLVSITVVPTGDVKNILDRRIPPFYDNLLTSLGTFNRNRTEVVKLMQNDTLLIQYSGTTKDQQSYLVDFYYSISGDKTITVMNAAKPQFYKANAQRVKATIDSLQINNQLPKPANVQQQVNHQPLNQNNVLTGRWLNTEEYYSDSTITGISLSSKTHVILEFHANGTCSWTQGGELGASTHGSTVIGNSGKKVWTGKWKIQNGKVNAVWNDSSVTNYAFTPFSHNGQTSILFIIDGKKRYFHPVR